MDKNNKFSQWAVLLLVLSVFTVNMVRYAYRVPKRQYCDFRVYYATGERFLQKEDIYSRPDERITPFKYSPMFAMIFSPLSRLPIYTASLVFFVINFAVFLFVLFLCARMINIENFSLWKKWIFYLISIACVARFVLQVWDSGQVNLLMLAAVLCAIFFQRKKKNVLTGAFLAFGILIKYMPAVFLLYWILRREWKPVIWTAIFLVIFLMLPILVVGVEQNMMYLKVWLPSIIGTSLDHGSYYDYKNQSLYSLVLRTLTDQSAYGKSLWNFSYTQGMAISVGIGAVMYFIVLWPLGQGFRKLKEQQWVIEIAMLLVIMALFNPNAWMVNFVALMFPYMVILKWLLSDRPVRWGMGLVFLISFGLASLISESIAGNDLQNFSEGFSCVTWASLWLWVVLAVVKFGAANSMGEKKAGVL